MKVVFISKTYTSYKYPTLQVSEWDEGKLSLQPQGASQKFGVAKKCYNANGGAEKVTKF
jgi:hypothetical protein